MSVIQRSKELLPAKPIMKQTLLFWISSAGDVTREVSVWFQFHPGERWTFLPRFAENAVASSLQ